MDVLFCIVLCSDSDLVLPIILAVGCHKQQGPLELVECACGSALTFGVLVLYYHSSNQAAGAAETAEGGAVDRICWDAVAVATVALWSSSFHCRS